MDNLTRGDLQALINEINPLLKNASVRSFQTIAPRKFILQAYKESRLISFLLCLQEPFLRIHLWTGSQKGTAHPHEEKIVEQVVKEMTLLNADRIVKITFENQWALIAELFPKRPNLFLITPAGEIGWGLNPVDNPVYTIPVNPFQHEPFIPSPGVTSESVEAYYQQKEFEAAKHSARLELESRVKKARKAQEKALDELKKCQQWEAVQHEGQLLQANFHMLRKGLKNITVTDWTLEGITRELELDPELIPKDQVAKKFKLSKKLKGGLPFSEKRVTKADEEVQHYNAELAKLEVIQRWEDLPPVPTSVPRVKPTPSQPYHEFQSASGLKIWVGKAAKSNEKLTFNLAKGSDWWLHVSDYPGSHVVIRIAKHQEPDHETLQDAIQVALAYSKAKEKGKADIIVTQCKYVSKLKRGAPGQVQISKHQTYQARFDANRFENIKARGKERT